MNRNNPWKTVDTKVAYENNWIRVDHIDVINPSGNKGIYGKVHFKNIAVGVIPLDSDYNTWIVGQYRFPLDTYSWEIPEGGSPVGEDPLISAKRELKEETGITAKDWTKFITMHTSNSVTDEVAHIYVAQELTFGNSNPEETEELDLVKLPFNDLYDKTINGEITDAMSVAAILKLKVLIDCGKV